jgi:redox-regulated HSP33 family molecular chaperone
VFEHASVRGALVSLDATSRSILGSHDYPRPLARSPSCWRRPHCSRRR